MNSDTMLLGLAIASCAIPFVLAVLVLWVPKKVITREFESSIDMDGAIFLQASNGSIVIRRRNTGILLAIAAFTMLLFGISIGLISAFVSAIRGQHSPGLEDKILALVMVVVLIGMIISAIRSFQKETYYFDVQTKNLTVNERNSSRQFKFNEIGGLILESGGKKRLSRFFIKFISGERILIGSVSGTGAKQRGEGIARAIADVVRISVEHQALIN